MKRLDGNDGKRRNEETSNQVPQMKTGFPDPGEALSYDFYIVFPESIGSELVPNHSI